MERGDPGVACWVSILIADDAVGLGQDVDRAEVVAEEAVKEGGLAGVDLAGDDDEEGRAEAGFDFLERQAASEVGGRFEREPGDAAHHL